MNAHYGVSRWPDEKEIYAKMDRLVNEPIHHIKPEAMQKYMKYFEEKCSGSKKMAALHYWGAITNLSIRRFGKW